MAVSATHSGWRLDPEEGQLDFYYKGTRVGDIDASGLTVDGVVSAGSISVTEIASGSATSSGNHTFSSTITAGADGVGTDGEQLTSGGAAAECDWAAAGSLRAFKKVLGIRDDAADALKMIAETPVYDFKYRPKSEAAPGERITNTGDVETVYTGIMADEAPWAMHHNGRILNPINTFGYTMLAIKALLARVEDLEGQLKVARA